ncbi:hypothetical protein RUND412_000108 [Rhizina undulata]
MKPRLALHSYGPSMSLCFSCRLALSRRIIRPFSVRPLDVAAANSSAPVVPVALPPSLSSTKTRPSTSLANFPAIMRELEPKPKLKPPLRPKREELEYEKVPIYEFGKEKEDPKSLPIRDIINNVQNIYGRFYKKEAYRLIVHLLSEGHSNESISKVWATLTYLERARSFELIMSYIIENRSSKRLSMRLLSACSESLFPPNSESVAIIYAHLVEKSLYERTPDQVAGLARQLISLLMTLQQRKDGNVFNVPQRTIWIIIRAAHPEDLMPLYNYLISRNIRITKQTQFHFIDRLCELETTYRAGFEMLTKLADTDEDLQGWSDRRCFSRVFNTTTKYSDEQASNEIIKTMMSKHLSPNEVIYNILMHKAIRAGNVESARNIFREMFAVGCKPTLVTFGIQHNLYKRMSNEADKYMVVRKALELDSRLNPVFATDMLHDKALNSEDYLSVLREYFNFFRAGPLQALGLAWRQPQDHFRMMPDHYPVGILVHSFCQHVADIRRIWQTYEKYRIIMSNEEHAYHPLMKAADSYLTNAFMLGLGKYEEGLPYCAVIMEDMMTKGSLVKPNVYSWSILMNSLASTGRTKDAEGVLRIMKEKGIEPNVVTWTSLLKGYIRNKDTKMAGNVIKRMTDCTVEPNNVTLSMLTDIIDSEEFIGGMTGNEELNE